MRASLVEKCGRFRSPEATAASRSRLHQQQPTRVNEQQTQHVLGRRDQVRSRKSSLSTGIHSRQTTPVCEQIECVVRFSDLPALLDRSFGFTAVNSRLPQQKHKHTSEIVLLHRRCECVVRERSPHTGENQLNTVNHFALDCTFCSSFLYDENPLPRPGNGERTQFVSPRSLMHLIQNTDVST